MNRNDQTLIECGTVIEAKPNQAVVNVSILGRETGFLPILQQANEFKQHYVPPRVGQQVVVLIGRYVLGSIFNKECVEPETANTKKEVTLYEDGTEISYDSNTHTLEVKGLNVLNITTNQSVNITTTSTVNIETTDAKVKAATVVVDSKDIQLNGGTGVVTGAHICALTGLPHADCSSTVIAGK